jgi:hypothetical protein
VAKGASGCQFADKRLAGPQAEIDALKSVRRSDFLTSVK